MKNMEQVKVRKEDQILMSLVHYFVTEKNYSPIYVRGVKDEIWLENLDGPYRVIRINSNRIFNNEQFNFDQIKIKDILKQIKKKTLSLSVNALNINLNEDDQVEMTPSKNVDTISLKDYDDVKNNKLLNDVFPKIGDNLLDENIGLDLVFSVTRDINAKTDSDNKRYEKIFSAKVPLMTYIIIGLCILAFFVQNINYNWIVSSFAIGKKGLLSFELYRLITYGFLHGDIIHLLCNIYSLNVIGKEVESKFGKVRFLGIYLLSLIGGGLLSSVFNSSLAIGASGAIFGLLGAYVYFGNRFRLYFKDALKSQIIPIIILNLGVGLLVPGIDNAGHIGGLILGYLSAMALGIPNDKKRNDIINGIILTVIFLTFLAYLIYFR